MFLMIQNIKIYTMYQVNVLITYYNSYDERNYLKISFKIVEDYILLLLLNLGSFLGSINLIYYIYELLNLNPVLEFILEHICYFILVFSSLNSY
jgi:hypothetical protein